MTLSHKELYGLVLMGGKSSRMGKDKSQLMINNQPLYKRQYDLLSSLCDQVFLSCNSEQAKHIPADYPKLVDLQSFTGPMSGIRNAFSHSPTNWLVIPIDMPMIDKEFLNKMISEYTENENVVCALDSNEMINPLLAIYSKSCNQLIANYSGDSPREFVKSVSFKTVLIKDEMNINLNRPNDVELFQSKLGMS